VPRWQRTIKTIYNPRVKGSAGVFTFKTLGNAFQKKNFRKHHLKIFFLVRWHAFEHQKFTKFITKLVLCLQPDAGSQAYHTVVTELVLCLHPEVGSQAYHTVVIEHLQQTT
jgi:hypothetical protein